MEEEKRRFTRFKYSMPMELKVEDKMYQIDEISDLSVGGCLIPFRVDAEPGTPCELKIRLGIESENPVVRVCGEVLKYRHDNETAMIFTRIDPDSLNHLQQIARYNSPYPEAIDKEIRKHPGIK